MIYRLRSLIYCVSVILAFSVVASAQTYFTGTLSSAQEVPPNSSTATGFGRVTLNEAETQITVSVHWSGLSGNATAGHIHGPAAVGSNGPIIFNLSPLATPAGSVLGATFSVTQTQVADFKAGLWYFNIHTSANPGGEIRGQLTVDAPYIVHMTGGQENPPVNGTATGRGVVSVNATGTQALVTMSWAGLTGNATAGHVHSGRSGVNGPIVCNLSPAAVTSGAVTDALCTFTGPQITSLRQGQFYLNVHTAANPGGEIRGQIQRRRSTVVDFDGDGRTDASIARTNGVAGVTEWWIANSGGGVGVFPHGTNLEFSATRVGAHDFDGDGKDDPWIFRNLVTPNAGFIIFQSSNFTVRFEQFGTSADDPRVVYDYDGDGRADPAVFRNSDGTWYYLGSSNNAARAITYVRWGTSFPNPGDFDGDGRGDFLNQQGNVWWLLRSSDLTVRYFYFGTSTMFGTPGDYDGDGKTDIAGTLTESTQLAWYYLSSVSPNQNVYLTRQAWGPGAPSTSRVRAQGDYDGDGRSDYGVYLTTSPQAFWVLPSNGTAPIILNWGSLQSDFPIPGYNNR